MQNIDTYLQRADGFLLSLLPNAAGDVRNAIERWRSDAAALRFHLSHSVDSPIVAVLGGTGTGKSTLVNRLLGQDISATSFQRTYTAGPIAIVRERSRLPAKWLGIDHVESTEPVVRGTAGSLVVVSCRSELTDSLSLIDTPDLDGDEPAHHVQADRVFRWAQALLFVVTPEKYQMTELLPYYRLARRYGLPALYVMNKCEEDAVVEDYRRILSEEVTGSAISIFVVARDDAAYQPDADANLDSLGRAIMSVKVNRDAEHRRGLLNRSRDVLGRLTDQIIAPLREQRRQADQLIAALRAMETPPAGVDVNPITQQLQRRMQQRSILYLMGPQRILDRVRQAPSLLVRLPRVAWDYVMRGDLSAAALEPRAGENPQGVPDFRAMLIDQFALVQARIDDVLRTNSTARRWLDDSAQSYSGAQLALAEAGAIADEELASLKQWLEKRWNATPRDTRALQTLLKHLPGGAKMAKWSEAAPYLLTIILVTHHAFFGHIDLIVLGGYGLATWLSEKLSNEVASRTRVANLQIAERFSRLAHQQIRGICDWLDRQAPPIKKVSELDRMARDIADDLGTKELGRL